MGRGVYLRGTVTEAGECRDGEQESLPVAGPKLDAIDAGLALQFAGAALGYDAPLVDDHDSCCKLVGFVEVLGGEHDVGAICSEHSDRVPKLDSASRVESRC